MDDDWGYSPMTKRKTPTLWMEEILHDLGELKPFGEWDEPRFSTGDSDFAAIHCSNPR